MLYSMVVIRPDTNLVVWVLAEASRHAGVPAYLPTKTFHVLSFGVWALLLHGALAGAMAKAIPGPRRTLFFWAVLLVYLALPEAFQGLTGYRGPSLWDVAINATGAILALLGRALLLDLEGEPPQGR